MNDLISNLLQGQEALRAEIHQNMEKVATNAKNAKRSQAAFIAFQDWKLQQEYRRMSIVLKICHYEHSDKEDVAAAIELFRKHLKAVDNTGEWASSQIKLNNGLKRLCENFDEDFDYEEIDNLLEKEPASAKKPRNIRRATAVPAPVAMDTTAIINALFQKQTPIVCTFAACGKNGHKEENCWMKFPDKRPKKA